MLDLEHASDKGPCMERMTGIDPALSAWELTSACDYAICNLAERRLALGALACVGCEVTSEATRLRGPLEIEHQR